MEKSVKVMTIKVNGKTVSAKKLDENGKIEKDLSLEEVEELKKNKSE